jgi:hypothetical protein
LGFRWRFGGGSIGVSFPDGVADDFGACVAIVLLNDAIDSTALLSGVNGIFTVVSLIGPVVLFGRGLFLFSPATAALLGTRMGV